jgi:hypothetical protein
MPAKRDKRTVVRMWAVVIEVIRVRSILEAVCVLIGIDAVSLFFRHHFPQIPKLSGLVFAVTKHIPSIPFAVNIRQPLGMAKENTSFSAITHAPSVPDLERRVVRAGVKNMWRLSVTEADCIYVILMTWYA